MLYMVIEKYRHGPGPVYQRAAKRGRLLPDGLRYVDSWVIEILPVVRSAEAARRVGVR